MIGLEGIFYTEGLCAPYEKLSFVRCDDLIATDSLIRLNQNDNDTRN